MEDMLQDIFQDAVQRSKKMEKYRIAVTRYG